MACAAGLMVDGVKLHAFFAELSRMLEEELDEKEPTREAFLPGGENHVSVKEAKVTLRRSRWEAWLAKFAYVKRALSRKDHSWLMGWGVAHALNPKLNGHGSDPRKKLGLEPNEFLEALLSDEGARARRCVRHRWSTHESARFVSAAGECGGAMGAPLAAGWESDRIMAAASCDSGRIDCARRAKVEARSGDAPVTVAEAEALPALATLVRISMSCVIIVASAPAVKVMLPMSTRCLPTRFLSSLVSSFAWLKGTPYSTAMSTSPGRTTTIPA